MVPAPGPGDLWSRPRSAGFGAGKSGRSLQRATGGGRVSEGAGARARVCASPAGVASAAGGLCDRIIRWRPRGFGETCLPACLLPPCPWVTFFARPMMFVSNLSLALAYPPNLMLALSTPLVRPALLCGRWGSPRSEGLRNPRVLPPGVAPEARSSLCCPCR